jgi:hypothetical protein
MVTGRCSPDTARLATAIEHLMTRSPPPSPVFGSGPAIRRDSRAWKAQVWISFALAVALCGIGLAYLPGQELDRAFMVMGYFFCLSSAFVLAKFVRDREASAAGAAHTDTPLWNLVVWGGFGLAMALTGWGLLRMQVNPAYKAFLGVSWLYLISSVFTLAKTLRDAHEAALAEKRPRHEADEAAGDVRAST